ncbi:hypothetical protein DFH28DRAFT_1102810 [Melampsora americana]|nr:hypothetical protein DFH28DRAFT_1102810 [Melampsora americana]
MIKSVSIKFNSIQLIQFISTKSKSSYQLHQHLQSTTTSTSSQPQYQYPSQSQSISQSTQTFNPPSQEKFIHPSSQNLQSTSTLTLHSSQSLNLNSITETLIDYLNQNNYSAFKELYSKHVKTTFDLKNGLQTLISISKIFKSLSSLGEGMGLMRRMMKSLHLSNYPTGSHLIIQEYIRILIKWGRLDRALNYLRMFDFHSIDHQVYQLSSSTDPVSNQYPNLFKSNLPQNLFKVNQIVWESLLTIYLMMNQIELVLKIQDDLKFKKIDWSDECLNQFLIAKIIQIQQSIELDSNEKIERLNQFIQDFELNPNPIGLHQSLTIFKLKYHHLGLDELLKLIEFERNDQRLMIIRKITILWLDSLLDPNHDHHLINPVQVGNRLIELNEVYRSNQDLNSDSNSNLNLIDEFELEKFTRYMRKWLERKIKRKIQFSFQSDLNRFDETFDRFKTQSILTLDRDDPELGYHQLETLLNLTYPSSDSSEDERLKKRPSSRMISELSRIESMIGSSSESIRTLIRESIIDRELNMKSSHLIGLIWTKIIEVDLIGLLYLIERELRFGYRLVLTGFLIGLVLGGLVAIRVPKSILLSFSQRLIDQEEMNSSIIGMKIQDSEADPGPKAYLRAARAAASVGNFFLVKELHLDLMNKFGHDVYWNEACGIDYLTMVVESLMKLNEPIEAHEEILKVFKESSLLESWIKEEDLMRLERSPTEELIKSHYFVNEEIRRYLHEKEEMSELIEKGLIQVHPRKSKKKKERMMKVLVKIKKRLEQKITNLERLVQQYSIHLDETRMKKNEKGIEDELDDDHQTLQKDGKFDKRLMEVKKRLEEFKVAEGLNQEVMEIWSKKSRGQEREKN